MPILHLSRAYVACEHQRLTLLLRGVDAAVIQLVRQPVAGCVSVADWWVHMLHVDRIDLGTQMRQHVVPTTGSALVPQRCDVNRCHDDTLTGTGGGLGQNAPVVID